MDWTALCEKSKARVIGFISNPDFWKQPAAHFSDFLEEFLKPYLIFLLFYSTLFSLSQYTEVLFITSLKWDISWLFFFDKSTWILRCSLKVFWLDRNWKQTCSIFLAFLPHRFFRGNILTFKSTFLSPTRDVFRDGCLYTSHPLKEVFKQA